MNLLHFFDSERKELFHEDLDTAWIELGEDSPKEFFIESVLKGADETSR
jgi:hypothetical protein